MLKEIKKSIFFTVIGFTLVILAIFGLLLYLGFGTTSASISTQIWGLYIVLSVIFVTVSIIMAIFLNKVILAPTLELLKNADMIIRGETLESEYLKSNSDEDTVKEFVKKIVHMDGNLRDSLNEMTMQKNEIETILLHMKDGVISFDIKGNISHVNEAAKEALLIDEKDNFDSVCTKLKVEFDMEKLIYLDTMAKQNKILDVNERTYKVFFAPLKAEDKAYGIIIMLHDMTDELQLDKMRKRFVADVSHELKTPITSILGYSDTIIQDAEISEEIDKKQTKYFVEKISKEANRMSELVQDLLTLSKYDTNTHQRKKEDFNIKEVIKEVVERFKQQYEFKNISVINYATAEVPDIFADRFGIERVITNIVSNAIKYTPENGEISIYIGHIHNNVYVKIKDSGIGIAKDDIKKIFERFYRVDNSRVRQSGGTGLGLSIAKEIMDKNGGTIDINSELGKGTEVVLTFPKSQKL